MAERTMDLVVRVSTDARQAASELRAYAEEIEQIGQSGAAAAGDLSEATEATVQLGDAARETASASQDLGEAGRESGREIQDGLGDVPDLGEAMSGAFKGATLALAGLVSIEGLRRFVTALYEAGAQARELQGRLEFATGGPEAAATKLKELGGTAAELGETLDAVTAAYRMLGRDTAGPEQAAALFARLVEVAKASNTSIGETVQAWREAKDAGLDLTASTATAFANIAAASDQGLADIVPAITAAAEGEYAALEDFGIQVAENGQRLVVQFRGQSVEIANDAKTLISKLEEIGNVNFAGANADGPATLGDGIDKLSASVTALAAQMAEDSGMMDGVEKLAGWLDDVATATAQAQAAFKGLSPEVQEGVSAVQALGGPLAKAASAFGPLGSAVAGAGAKYAEFMGGLDAFKAKMEASAKASAAAAPQVQTLAQVLAEIGVTAADAKTRVADLDAKLQALGVSVKSLNTPVVSAADAFDALIRSTDVTGDGMVKGLEAALARVSDGEIPRLTQAWEAARVAGQVTSEQYAAGMTQIQTKLASLPAAITPLETAFKDLGVTSQASLDATAAKARAAFEVIASGQVPLARLQEAFNAYAQAATAANNGVVPAAIRAEAAQRGLTVALDSTAGAAGRAKQASGAAASALSAQTSATAKAASTQDTHSAALSKGAQMLAAFQSAQATEAAEIARANAIKAASWEQVNAAQITYSEWSTRSGAADAQRLASQQSLATAVGAQGEKVRALSLALAEANAKNAEFANGQDAFGAAELAKELEAAKAQAESLKTQLQALTGEAVTPEVDDSQIQNVKKEIGALDGVTTYSQHTAKSNVPAVLAEIQSLDGKNTSSTHTIYVKKVESNNTGGTVGLGAVLRHDGGSIFRRPAWSLVPGVGDTDSVPAGLPSGAFVLRKAATRYYGATLRGLNGGGLVNTLLTPGERWFPPATVRRHGTPFFERLNRLEIPRAELSAALSGTLARFNAGGSVGAASPAGAQDTVKVELSVGRTQVRMQSARDQAQSLVRALSELQRGR